MARRLGAKRRGGIGGVCVLFELPPEIRSHIYTLESAVNVYLICCKEHLISLAVAVLADIPNAKIHL